ncbi:hypothetical protein N7532_000201 [Penicillium argentinense]|uniref:Cell wall galactomannoprotein n=1 Tax=Penicillium argentinense TaxID=1131581 RepID=A0A9W9KNL3_9EURO|nr:uncharacterized protein N7532_000201 [Penicillium argentinense]KAJ5112156.1 hypothetical protein N7532_000201 [Penicillium argentinense]
MLVTRVLAVAALAVTNVLAIANIDQTVSDIQEITHKTRVVKRAIENFNGGIPSALRVANAIYSAHAAAEMTRKHIGSSDPFSDEDGDKTMDAYNEFYPVLLATLQAGQEKAPEVRRSGFAYLTQGMVSNLYNEKTRVEEAMHSQLSSNHSRMLEPTMHQVDIEFKKTLDSYQG